MLSFIISVAIDDSDHVPNKSFLNFSAADALIVQLLKGEERVIYTSSNRSIMEKGAISRSCINLSWLTFFRLRKHIFRERDLGAKDRNTVKSSE